MTKPGRVFSIEEFSTFDGPGIRMTVFLKGRPWCHNPEGQRFAVEYMRAHNGCTGCGAPEMFERVLAVCDFVLYDLKLYDAGAHKAVCGVDNTLILHNYRTLVRSGKVFITRVPLIPGITDTEENDDRKLKRRLDAIRKKEYRRERLILAEGLNGFRRRVTEQLPGRLRSGWKLCI